MGNLEVIPELWPVSGQVLVRRLIRLLLLPLFSSLTATATFNAEHLKKQAEIDGLGYKTANLLVLKNLASRINRAMTPYLIAMPDFVGINDQTVQQFLKAQGLDINTQWKLMLDQAAGPHQQQKMLKNKQLSVKFRQTLETLQQRIAQVCEKSTASNIGSLNDFLNTAQQSNWPLMVRSTGKEDSETLANAGGNVSVANVPAQDIYVMRAIGEVLASYVSAKSMQQRLQAGDTTVFEIPFLPVLIQRMIGEPIGGAKDATNIPTGCVLYTTETDGFTPGVALVQATFGHNEGVVQSSMPIDSFYLCKNITYASIKQKTKRLIPGIAALQHTLIEQANPANIVSNPSLAPRALKSLFIIAHEVEQFYGKPMDLELVVMPHEQTIYLVQARPIVMPKNKEPSRYLRDVSAFKQSQRIACTIINSNRGALLEKVGPNQIIMAKSLEKALTEFNELSEGKDDIRVIAVEEEAETTSHAAAVFRGEGKVIIRLANGLKQLEDIMMQSKASIAISTQQGIIIDLTEQAQLTEKQITYGLSSHPVNLPLSITAQTGFWPLFSYPHNSKQDADKLLHTLKSNPTDSAILNALCAAVGRQDVHSVHPVLQKSIKEIQFALRKKRTALQHFISSITAEIASAEDNKDLIVFHLRMLELAIMQQPHTDYVQTYSHTSLRAEGLALSSFLNDVIAPALASKKIARSFIHHQNILSLAQNGYNRCLTEVEQQAWLAFLDAHGRNIQTTQHADIIKLLNQLIRDDLLGGWINTSLIQTTQRISGKDAASYKTMSASLTHEFNSAQKQLTTLDKVLELMMNIQPTEWENPKKFDALFARFDRTIVTPLKDETFDDLLDLCETIDNNVLKLAVITGLKKITDRYDLFIKAIKGSTQYSTKTLKIQHFHAMLNGYVHLLDKICNNDDLINALKERLEDFDVDNEDELIVSNHFNVNVVVQQTMLDRGFSQQKFFDYIESLEDLFTSTHQVLLNEISKKIVSWNITQGLRKPTLVTAIEEVLELEDHLTGIRFEGTKVTFTYNRQLRAHSIQIEICYDCSTKKVTLGYHFYGINEFLRWNLIKDYVTLISPKLNLDIERIVLRDYGLSLHWNVPSANKAQALDELLEDAIDVTFELSIENRKTIFDHFDTTLETLFEKCSQLYDSSEKLTQYLSTTSKDANFNFLTLPMLDDIAKSNHKVAKYIFKQGLKVVEQIVNSESHDNLVTAHYILAEITNALEEIKGFKGPKIKLPKRVRLGNFKTYNRVVTKLLDEVHAAVDEL